MKIQTATQVCTCENCGNEAEMILSCTWVDLDEKIEKPQNRWPNKEEHATGTCTHCGNEADIWVEL